MNPRSYGGGHHPRNETEQALRSVFLFRQWSDEDLRDIAAISSIRTFKGNSTIFHHATPCRHLYVVMHGRIQLSRLTADGRETVIHAVGPGELLAVAALFLDRAYPATARVTSPDAGLLVLDGAGFLDKLSRRSELSFQVIAALSMRISKLTVRIESRATESSEQRVASWLLEQLDGPRPDQRVILKSTKRALAEDLGMTPETLSRVLAKFRSGGILEVNRRKIEILSAAKLKDLA